MAGNDNSKLRRWVIGYGIDRLAWRLRVTPAAVYQWISPSHHTHPRPVLATRIIRISRNKISLQDIYHQ